jgi:hypothetical protein
MEVCVIFKQEILNQQMVCMLYFSCHETNNAPERHCSICLEPRVKMMSVQLSCNSSM